MPDLPEDKERAVGVCGFFIVFVLASAAFALSVASTGFCAFVSRNIVLSEPASDFCAGVSNGDIDQCETTLSNHGIGFWGWQASIPNAVSGGDTLYCLSYTQPVAGVGWVTPTFDTKFNAAKGFAIAADFFGMFAFFTLAISSCCPLEQGRMKCLSIYFFLATFFQGMVFIIMKSSACTIGFFGVYFPDVDSVESIIQSVSCGLSTGSKCAVAATVLYFLCMILTPAAIPPKPIGLDDSDEL